MRSVTSKLGRNGASESGALPLARRRLAFALVPFVLGLLVLLPTGECPAGASNGHGTNWLVNSINGDGTYPSCNEVHDHDKYWSAWAETRHDAAIGNCVWARTSLYVFFTETWDTGWVNGDAYVASPTGGTNAGNDGSMVGPSVNYRQSSWRYYHL